MVPYEWTSSTPWGPKVTGVEKKGDLVKLFSTNAHSLTFFSLENPSNKRLVNTLPAYAYYDI